MLTTWSWPDHWYVIFNIYRGYRGTTMKTLYLWKSDAQFSLTHTHTHTKSCTQWLFSCSDWNTLSLCSESVRPLGLWHFCFPGLPLALSDSDGVSNKQSLSLATSAQLKTTGIVKRAFVYRNLQVSIAPTAISTFFLSLPLSFYCLFSLCFVSCLLKVPTTILTPSVYPLTMCIFKKMFRVMEGKKRKVVLMCVGVGG